MKKSLSVILSAAMGFSMFASVAFGATQSTADFSDLKDLTPDQKKPSLTHLSVMVHSKEQLLAHSVLKRK